MDGMKQTIASTSVGATGQTSRRGTRRAGMTAEGRAHRDLMRQALGDAASPHGDTFVGLVRFPGEAFNRMLYRMRDGLFVAGQPAE